MRCSGLNCKLPVLKGLDYRPKRFETGLAAGADIKQPDRRAIFAHWSSRHDTDYSTPATHATNAKSQVRHLFVGGYFIYIRSSTPRHVVLMFAKIGGVT